MSSQKELDGKVALVTGGGKNIGRAIVLELADAGAHVAIIALSDTASAASVAEEARQLGVEAEAYQCDVTDEAALKTTIDAIEQRFGSLDILVNNAALRTEVAFEQLSLQEWHHVLAVTLDGAFLCTRTALPLLKASDAAAVVNIGGLSAYTGATERAHVITAKAGLGGLTRALAIELAPHAITVNLVAPGLIDTVRAGQAPQHHHTRTTLVGRKGAPREVATLVRYLAGSDARYVTGQTMHVNGGTYLG